MAEFYQNYCCQRCSMTFQSAVQLANHHKRFCINSGFDSLSGLQQFHKNTINKKKHLKNYGQSSLGSVKYQPDFMDHKLLQKDVKDVKKHKEQIQAKDYYKFNQNYINNQSYNSQISQSKTSNNLSKVSHDNDDQKYISPPTMGEDLKNIHSVLHKSNQSIKNMSNQQKQQYASVKLNELKKIKSLYEQNGGGSQQFHKNINKMTLFYEKMLKEVQQTSLMVESRVSTPILKLRQLGDSNLKYNSPKDKNYFESKHTSQSQSQRKDKQIHKNNVVNGLNASKRQYFNDGLYKPQYNSNQPYYNSNKPYYPNHPQIIMMPYAPPNPVPQQNQNLKILQRMMVMKNEENLRLIELLGKSKQRQQKQLTSAKNQRFKNDEQHKFYLQNSQVGDQLVNEERILAALQKQEIDQLRLFSNLPEELQNLKLESVAQAAQIRFNMEKHILNQRLKRIQNSDKIHKLEDQRNIQNQNWIAKQRQRVINEQISTYFELNQQQKQFNQNQASNQ